ncbi:MAG: hypothetical protein NTV73_18690 [Hyphomicrobiales bacterium]|nr:hypothetical protein [Hyphomicrobiales bacterium]
MTSKTGTSTSSARRAARLAEELRANLRRRRAQTRSRRTGEADERPEGLGLATEAGDEEPAVDGSADRGDRTD